jgi:hypothetical protein
MSYDKTDKDALNGVDEVFKPILEQMKEQMEQGNKPKEMSMEDMQSKFMQRMAEKEKPIEPIFEEDKPVQRSNVVQIGQKGILVPPGGPGLVNLAGEPLKDHEKERQKKEAALLKAMLGGGDLKVSGYTKDGDPIYKLSPEQAAKYKKLARHQKQMKKKKAQQEGAHSTLSPADRKKRLNKNKQAKKTRQRNRRKK